MVKAAGAEVWAVFRWGRSGLTAGMSRMAMTLISTGGSIGVTYFYDEGCPPPPGPKTVLTHFPQWRLGSLADSQQRG